MSRAARLLPQSLTPRQAAVALAAAGLVTTVTACGVSTAASPAKPAATAFTNAAATTFTVGQPAGFAISTSGPKAALTETGSVPAGLSFHPTRRGAMLTGRPASGTGGVYDIALAARDHGRLAAQLLTVTILQAPEFTAHPSISATAGVFTRTSFAVTAYPAGTISESGALPAGLHFQALANGTAVISGTPQVGGMSQSSSITLTAQNTAGTVKETISVTVAQPAPPPAPPVEPMAPPMEPMAPPMTPSSPPMGGMGGMG